MAGENVAFRRGEGAAAVFLKPAIQSNYTTLQRVAEPEAPPEEREPARCPFLHALECPRKTLPNGGGGKLLRHWSGASLEERRGRGLPTSRWGGTFSIGEMGGGGESRSRMAQPSRQVPHALFAEI